jgi:hypothetical protein
LAAFGNITTFQQPLYIFLWELVADIKIGPRRGKEVLQFDSKKKIIGPEMI